MRAQHRARQHRCGNLPAAGPQLFSGVALPGWV